MTTRSRTTSRLRRLRPRQSATSSIVGFFRTCRPLRYDGHVVDAHAETLERHLHARIVVGVEVRVRLVVARQELLQRQGARRVPGADEHDVSCVPRHEQGAAEDERPQKDLAQLRVRLDEAADALRGHLEDAARAARSCSDDGRMAGDEVDVAGKVAGMMDRHQRIPVGKDLDLALEHDHERTVRTALFEQDFVGREPSLASERRDPFDLRRGQRREDFLLGSAGSGAFRTHVGDAISKVSRVATDAQKTRRIGVGDGVPHRDAHRQHAGPLRDLVDNWTGLSNRPSRTAARRGSPSGPWCCRQIARVTDVWISHRPSAESPRGPALPARPIEGGRSCR